MKEQKIKWEFKQKDVEKLFFFNNSQLTIILVNNIVYYLSSLYLCASKEVLSDDMSCTIHNSRLKV